MGWKIVSLIFFLCSIGCLIWYAYNTTWPIWAAAFCFLVAVVTFAVSVFARRGSSVWQGRGKG